MAGKLSRACCSQFSTSSRCVYAPSLYSHVLGVGMSVCLRVYLCVCVCVSLTNISRTQVALKIIIYKKTQGLHKQLDKMVHTLRVYKIRVRRRKRDRERERKTGKPSDRTGLKLERSHTQFHTRPHFAHFSFLSFSSLLLWLSVCDRWANAAHT